MTTRLTVKTTGVTTLTAGLRLNRLLTVGGGGTVAAFLLFCIPVRRRKWLGLVGMLMLVAFAATVSGCSNTSGKVGGSTNPPVNSGTTSGNYTITVTGTSGSIQATTTVGITVQ